MKKVLIMVLSFVVLASLGGWAQTISQKSEKNTTTGKAMNIVGTVSSEGKMVVADKDRKNWKIDNPEKK